MVTEIGLANADEPAWWYGWLSSRDQHNSLVLGQMEWLARFRALIAATPDQRLLVVCAEAALAEAAARICDLAGRRLVAAPMDRLRWALRRRWRRLGRWLGAAKAVRHGFGLVRAAKRHSIAAARLDSHDLILVTIFDDSVRRQETDSYRDIYFGDAASRLSGENILICGQVTAAVAPVTAALAAYPAAHLASFGHFLEYRDVWHSAIDTLRARISIPAGRDDPALRSLAEADMARDAGYRCLGFLFERAMSRILRRNPGARVIHIYENNPWERACDRAARNATPRRDVAGYLHCAVLPAHLKNYIAAAEIGIRPAPDRILCTGPAARDVFLSLGAHDPARVEAACGLRDASMRQRTGIAPPARPIRRVLIILEGLDKMVGLLRFADAAARQYPDLEFCVRGHPAMPISHLAPRAGVIVAAGAALTPAGAPDGAPAGTPSLIDAIGAADAVLYQGSSAAFTAAYLGRPLIRFEPPSMLSDDPLFKCGAFKRSVRNIADISSAISEFDSWDEARYTAERDAARAYIDSYIVAPTPESLAAFARPDRIGNAA